MIKNDLKRYSKSYVNIILFVAVVIIVAICFFSAGQSAEGIQRQLQIAKAEGATRDISKLQEIVDGFSGISYASRLFFNGEAASYIPLAYIICFSVMFGSQMFTNLHYGFGNLIVTREKYKKYVFYSFASQSIYMAVIIAMVSAVITIAPILAKPPISGIPVQGTLGVEIQSLAQFIGMVCAQVAIIILYVVPLVNLTTVTPLFVSNKYLNMSLPLAFFMITYVFPNLLEVAGEKVQEIAQYIHPVVYLGCIADYYVVSSENYTVTDLLTKMAVLPIFIILCLSIITYFNIKRYEKDYIK